MSSLLAKDTLVHWLAEELANTIPVKTYTKAQQNLQLNALNIRFLTEQNLISMSAWEAMVSLDVLINDKFNSSDTSERATIKVSDKLFDVLKAGIIKKIWENAQWKTDCRYICWDTLKPGSLIAKDIPQSAPGDLYTHKNITMRITYFN